MNDDFIEPTKQSKRSLLLTYAALAVLLLILQAWAIPGIFEYVKFLPFCDQISALEKMTFVIICISVAAGVWGFFYGRHVIRHEQISLPDAWVFRRTPTRRGRFVCYQGVGLLVLSLVLIVSPFATWRFVEPVFDSLATQYQCPHRLWLNTSAAVLPQQ